MGKSLALASLLMMFSMITFDRGSRHYVYGAQTEKGKVKKGRTIGVVTGKGDPAKREYFIEVKADGDQRPRKYAPRWVGGVPAKGGGFDKAMLKTFAALELGTRVEVDWHFDERLRAVKIAVLKAPPKE
jgi:hypothetical protein